MREAMQQAKQELFAAAKDGADDETLATIKRRFRRAWHANAYAEDLRARSEREERFEERNTRW